MSQKDDVLQWLKTKPITPLQALQCLGVFRLASVIHKLRRRHNIKTDLIESDGKTFAQYSLENKK